MPRALGVSSERRFRTHVAMTGPCRSALAILVVASLPLAMSLAAPVCCRDVNNATISGCTCLVDGSLNSLTRAAGTYSWFHYVMTNWTMTTSGLLTLHPRSVPLENSGARRRLAHRLKLAATASLPITNAVPDSQRPRLQIEINPCNGSAALLINGLAAPGTGTSSATPVFPTLDTAT